MKKFLKPFDEINQTDTAKRKLKNIAKKQNLPLEFVSILYGFYWDLDPLRPSESIGWVSREQYSDDDFAKGSERICEMLTIDSNILLSKQQVINQLIDGYQRVDVNILHDKLLIAGEMANNCYLSEYANYHYYNHFTAEKLLNLADDEYTIQDLIYNLFLKVFRAGAIEQFKPFYAYTDLCVTLPYDKQLPIQNPNWIDELIADIERLENSKLSDLITCCQPFVKGDKYFKQRILQALSYAGKLRVKGINVSGIFLSDYKDELASHFYANEWTYPMRMWAENP